MYEEQVSGLESSDPAVVINSALWIIENPDKLEKIRENYAKACELLYYASLEDLECAQYICENLQDFRFKLQLFTKLYKEGRDEDTKTFAKGIIETAIPEIAKIKLDNTDIIAELLSYIEDTGDAELLEKAKKV